jgi:hypothetical protein
VVVRKIFTPILKAESGSTKIKTVLDFDKSCWLQKEEAVLDSDKRCRIQKVKEQKAKLGRNKSCTGIRV